MTKEEKTLLLQDLCGRLPYKVKGLHREQVHTVTNIEPNSINPIIKVDGYDAWFPIELFKPYLRSMSSMTAMDKKELRDEDILIVINTSGEVETTINGFDWLNKKQFDYRGLISLGLAIEAPEDMYNTKTE